MFNLCHVESYYMKISDEINTPVNINVNVSVNFNKIIKVHII